VVFAAGQTVANICVGEEIVVSAIKPGGLSCNNSTVDFSCSVDAVKSNFRLTYTRGGNNGSDWDVKVVYLGRDIPAGNTIKVRVVSVFDCSVGESWNSLTFSSFTRDTTFSLEGIGTCTITADSLVVMGCTYPETTTTPTTSTCDTAYQYKISRITNISYSTAGITTDTATLAASVASALAANITANCEAQADRWMTELDSCLYGRSDYTSIRTSLRAKLIEICELGGDADHQSGASTTPSGKSTAEGYTSFKDAIKGMLSLSALNMICNPWLLESPYPYDVHMQAASTTIEKSSIDICSKLSVLASEYHASGSTIGLYQYLVNKYGDAMTLSSSELTILQNSCNNCRYLLASELTLPVFMDPASTGAITATQFNTGWSAMQTEIGSWLDSTSVNYETVVATYLNQLWGFTLSYGDYKDYLDSLAAGSTKMLCNTPVYATVTVEPYSCSKLMIDAAVTAGTVLYNQYIEEVKRLFRKEYIAYCGAAQPALQMTTNEQLYHFTLYYYDQAGNLVRTVPPEGVHLMAASLQAQVDSARNHAGTNCTFDGAGFNTSKDSALLALTSAFSSTGGRALELWMYDSTASGGQFLAGSSI